MAHNLAQNEDGSYAWAGTTPAWHNLGTVVGRPMTSTEAIKLAGLDFQVEKIPVTTADGDPTNRFATVRMDLPKGHADRVLGIVSEGYQIINYTEAFKFFDQVIGKDQAVYDSVGVLNNGAKMFIVARLPSEFFINEDQFVNFVTLTSGHDSLQSLQALLTPVRVVCANTLSMAISNNVASVRLRHTRYVHQRLLKAPELLGLATKKFKELEGLFQRLVNEPITHPLFNQYVQELFPSTRDEDGRQPTKRVLFHRNTVQELFESPTNNTPGSGGTYYAAANAVMEYVDHHQPTRVGRMNHAIFKSGANLKQKAIELAFDYVDGSRVLNDKKT